MTHRPDREPLTISQACRFLNSLPESLATARTLCRARIDEENPRQVIFTVTPRHSTVLDLKHAIGEACHLSPSFGADTTLRVYVFTGYGAPVRLTKRYLIDRIVKLQTTLNFESEDPK